MQPHEYSIIGHNRARIGRRLGTVAAIIASSLAALGVVIFRIAEQLGLPDQLGPAIAIPISASLVFPIVHVIFDNWLWKHSVLVKILGVPDLNGVWDCEGQTIGGGNSLGEKWTGVVSVVQTWEKISVYLDTASSSSYSVAASLIHQPGRGFVLMYSYRNEPGISDTDLKGHIGYCELQIGSDIREATGDYFNNRGRTTYGKMKLKRRN